MDYTLLTVSPRHGVGEDLHAAASLPGRSPPSAREAGHGGGGLLAPMQVVCQPGPCQMLPCEARGRQTAQCRPAEGCSAEPPRMPATSDLPCPG